MNGGEEGFKMYKMSKECRIRMKMQDAASLEDSLDSMDTVGPDVSYIIAIPRPNSNCLCLFES